MTPPTGQFSLYRIQLDICCSRRHGHNCVALASRTRVAEGMVVIAKPVLEETFSTDVRPNAETGRLLKLLTLWCDPSQLLHSVARGL